MPKDKETKLVSMKRCAALKLRLGRKTPADRASVELLTPVTSVDDGTQPSASSTIALPSSSPPVSLSSSFFSIRTETLQTQPLLTSTPNTSFTPAYYTPFGTFFTRAISYLFFACSASAGCVLAGSSNSGSNKTINPISSRSFRCKIPIYLRHQVFAGTTKANPSRTKDVSTFCGSAATCNPRTARSKGGTFTGRADVKSGNQKLQFAVERGWRARPEG